jgi:hypothetical protein
MWPLDSGLDKIRAKPCRSLRKDSPHGRTAGNLRRPMLKRRRSARVQRSPTSPAPAPNRRVSPSARAGRAPASRSLPNQLRVPRRALRGLGLLPGFPPARLALRRATLPDGAQPRSLPGAGHAWSTIRDSGLTALKQGLTRAVKPGSSCPCPSRSDSAARLEPRPSGASFVGSLTPGEPAGPASRSRGRMSRKRLTP